MPAASRLLARRRLEGEVHSDASRRLVQQHRRILAVCLHRRQGRVQLAIAAGAHIAVQSQELSQPTVSCRARLI